MLENKGIFTSVSYYFPENSMLRMNISSIVGRDFIYREYPSSNSRESYEPHRQSLRSWIRGLRWQSLMEGSSYDQKTDLFDSCSIGSEPYPQCRGAPSPPPVKKSQRGYTAPKNYAATRSRARANYAIICHEKT